MSKKPSKLDQTVPLKSNDVKTNGAFIQLNKIVKIFTTAAGDFTVLKGIDAAFKQGEFVAVVGKSGSGKTTLINMITGIDRPTSGEVYIGDVAVHKLSEGQLAQWRGRNLGVVFQFFQLLPMLSLLENIMLPMDFCNMYSPRQRKERAMELLKQMELEEHANKLPTAISGGQQQRVAMARALANDPPLLVADEPTGNLDSHTAETIFKIFKDYIKQGKTILMVTHDSSLAKRASRTLLIADGEIVNEFVARALPLLSHQQMLMATHKITPLVYEPGASIIQQGTVGEKFFIITKGQVEIILKRPSGSDVVVARYGPSQYFGEIELMFGGGRNAATARAAPDMTVEVVALDLETFTELMHESLETRAAMAEIVDARVAENIQTRRGEKG